MASGGSGGTDGRGGSWPTSMGTPETDELIRFGLMVPPSCRLPHIFRITADGYPTRGPGATPDELRRHEGGRWNIDGRYRFWKGKDFWTVVGQLRRESETGGSSSAPRRPRRRPPAATSSPSSLRRPVPALAGPSAPPAAPPAVEIPPEQVALREDGDPDDSPGYLLALRASQAGAAVAAAAAATREAADLQVALDAAAAMAAAAEAADVQAALDAAVAMAAATEAADVQAALDAAAAMAAVQAATVEDDGVDWDAAVKSSDDDGGDGGAGEVVDLADSDDE